MIASLISRAIFRVSGSDAKEFLQGQLSNDIYSINEGEIQINAYCQHQGKVIALLWLFLIDKDFYISLPKELAELVNNRLNMFIMMSDVKIKDITSDIPQYGIIDQDCLGSYKLNERQSIFVGEAKDLEKHIHHESLWQSACIDTSTPEVYLSTTEKFVPQMLNLDINESGVSFTKGCYPGQEVVARLHYLGKAKRRMYKFKGGDISVGEELIVEESRSLRASGMVIRGAKSSNEYIYLVSIETDRKDDKITSHNGISLVRIKDV